RVLPEGLAAADGRVEPEVRALVEEVQEHLLVVAAQHDDPAVCRIAHEFEHVGDGAGDVFAAVYEIAEQDECVPPRVAREQREQLPELRSASVNVADDEGAQRTSSAGEG